MDLRQLTYFVAVAEELHFGRAAARLHMAQPPLSRAIKDLESHFGCLLLTRTPTGVRLTGPGETLLDEARVLLARTDRLRAAVVESAQRRTLVLGTLGESSGQLPPDAVAAFRGSYPHIQTQIREADLTDPTAGLRSGLVDVAITRLPFDTTGIDVHVIRRDPLFAVLPASDPLAQRQHVDISELNDRRWFQLPADTDPVWRAYWSGVTGSDKRDGPVVRTVAECLQSVIWDGSVGLVPGQRGAVEPPVAPPGTALVPIGGIADSPLVLAWASDGDDPLVREFVRITSAAAVDQNKL